MAEYIVDTTEGIYNARTTGELVRCRDCKHLRTYGGVRHGHYCARDLGRVERFDFCSKAERKRERRTHGTRD